MRSPSLIAVASVFLTASLVLCAEEVPSFRVIVNAGNPKTSASRAEVADIFLKKMTRWADGSGIAPVDQSAASVARRAFTNYVLRQSLGTIQEYWTGQIFSGRDTPPPVKTSDQEVIAYVVANRGAIGYVSAEGNLPEAVRVLRLTE